MEDLQGLKGFQGQGSLDFAIPIEILEQLGNQDGEKEDGDATDLTQTVANPASGSQTETFSRSGAFAAAEETARMDQPKGETANDFGSWERLLLSTEKGGLGRKNSKYFNRVQAALEKTVGVLSKGFGNVAADNLAILREACDAFQALLDACKQYTARNPYTKAGKVRRNLVLQLQEYAQRDLYGCGDVYYEFLSMPPQEQSQETWQSVLSRSRTKKLTVDDFSKYEKAGGGQASEVIKIKSQEGNLPVTKYFKKEDSIDVSAGIGRKASEASKHIALQETLKRFPKLPKDEKEELRDYVLSGYDPSMTTKEGEDALHFYQSFFGKNKVTIEELMVPLGIVDEGGEANMTRRNVATSRMADLLGLGNLIAKSQTVEIFDKASGQTFRGNLMDQAEGEENEAVSSKLWAKQVTSGFIRDAMNLQVLDMLCGQGDRHGRNILYKTDQGKISGLQAIDNDGAFGTNIDAASSQSYNKRSDARVFHVETGEMIIPYMDKELADRIEALDSQMVRYVLSDLLKEAEINATIRRLEILKRGIQKAKVEQKDRFLEKEDWSKDEVGQKILNSYQEEKQKLSLRMRNDPSGKTANMQVIREALPNNPDMVEAVRVFIEDKKTFNDYSEKKQNAVRAAMKEMELFLYKKYRANWNYYGRLVDPHPDY